MDIQVNKTHNVKSNAMTYKNNERNLIKKFFYMKNFPYLCIRKQAISHLPRWRNR